jgi:hypothetical protein
MFAYDEIMRALSNQVTEWLIFAGVIWLACGLFSVIMMKKADAAAGAFPSYGKYWLKKRMYPWLSAVILVGGGIFSLPLGIWAMIDWRRSKNLFQHYQQ